MPTDQQNQNQHTIHFQGEGKAILETAKENIWIRWKLQEEDKEYLRKQNVDHHFDEVVNKTIEKVVGKHSFKYAGDNL